jgi:hypothetical protein
MLLMSLACDVIALGSNQVEVEDDGILAFKPKNKAIYISQDKPLVILLLFIYLFLFVIWFGGGN